MLSKDIKKENKYNTRETFFSDLIIQCSVNYQLNDNECFKSSSMINMEYRSYDDINDIKTTYQLHSSLNNLSINESSRTLTSVTDLEDIERENLSVYDKLQNADEKIEIFNKKIKNINENKKGVFKDFQYETCENNYDQTIIPSISFDEESEILNNDFDETASAFLQNEKKNDENSQSYKNKFLLIVNDHKSESDKKPFNVNSSPSISELIKSTEESLNSMIKEMDSLLKTLTLDEESSKNLFKKKERGNYIPKQKSYCKKMMHFQKGFIRYETKLNSKIKYLLRKLNLIRLRKHNCRVKWRKKMKNLDVYF